MNITLAQAEASIIAAKKKAVELNTKMNICVVDAGSNMVVFLVIYLGLIAALV